VPGTGPLSGSFLPHDLAQRRHLFRYRYEYGSCCKQRKHPCTRTVPSVAKLHKRKWKRPESRSKRVVALTSFLSKVRQGPFDEEIFSLRAEGEEGGRMRRFAGGTWPGRKVSFSLFPADRPLLSLPPRLKTALRRASSVIGKKCVASLCAQ
jgi:hypothetical protein